MESMTHEQAVELAESCFWEDMTPRERAEFQLFEDRLCMPFDVFQEALVEVLDRHVYTHELGSENLENLKREFLGEREPPTFDEILALIPKDYRRSLRRFRKGQAWLGKRIG